MFTKLLKQPLLHFLLIGAAFFLIFHFTSSNNPERDLKTVIVDKNSLITFMQYRSKKFNRNEFETKLANMSESKLNNLIEDYVREEVLYREALGLGMDKDDYLIRRRMVQKIEFINEQLTNNSQNITRQDVKDYYNKNLDDYKIEPSATFTHVYFSNVKNGTDKAKEFAENELIILNKNNVPFSDSVKHGNRFLYHLNYVEKTPEFIENHFGTKMSEEIFSLEPSDINWNGPFESQYGYHLVLLTDKKEEVIPGVEEVRDSIVKDLNYKLSSEAKEKSIKDIIDSYEVRVNYKPDISGTDK